MQLGGGSGYSSGRFREGEALWTALIHHGAAGPSVCVGVGVSRTRKWVLLHSIIHRACARGPASVLTAPPGPQRSSSRRTWRIVVDGPDEDVPRRGTSSFRERYKCDRVYDKSPVNATCEMF